MTDCYADLTPLRRLYPRSPRETPKHYNTASWEPDRKSSPSLTRCRGAGQVLLKVTAAGACHSDEFIMSLPK